MRFIRTSIFEHDTQSQTNIATYEIAFAEMNKSHSVLETAMQIERMKAGRTAVDVNGICTELDAVDVVNALNEAGEELNTLLWGDNDEHIPLADQSYMLVQGYVLVNVLIRTVAQRARMVEDLTVGDVVDMLTSLKSTGVGIVKARGVKDTGAAFGMSI